MPSLLGLFLFGLTTAFAGPSIAENTYHWKEREPSFHNTSWVVKNPSIKVIEQHYDGQKAAMSAGEAKNLINSIHELIAGEQNVETAYRGFYVQPDVGVPIEKVEIFVTLDRSGVRQTSITITLSVDRAYSKVVIRDDISIEELKDIVSKTIRNAERLQHPRQLAAEYYKLMNRLYIDLARPDVKDAPALEALLKRLKDRGYYDNWTLEVIRQTDEHTKVRVPRLLGIAEELRLIQEEYNAIVSSCEWRLTR